MFVAEAVGIYSSCGNLGCCAHALESAAMIVGQAGEPETATELLGAAEELRRSSGAAHKPFEIRARHSDLEDRIGPLSTAAHEAALTAGRQHTLESAARAALDALSTTGRLERSSSNVVANLPVVRPGTMRKPDCISLLCGSSRYVSGTARRRHRGDNEPPGMIARNLSIIGLTCSGTSS